MRGTIGSSSILFVCDSGGHLVEANEIAMSRYPDAHIAWYSSDTLMARSLLAGRDATFSRRRIRPGAVWSVLREIPTAVRFLRRRRFDRVVSTGSAYALPWIVAARLLRVDASYIESAARTTTLSRVGRLTGRVPGTALATQAPLSVDGWDQVPSVLVTAWQRRPARPERRPGPPRVVVTVGTFHYAFDRLMDRLDQVIPPDWEIVVQHGASRRIQRAVVAAEEFGYDEMLEAMAAADVVIAHCGVGTLVAAASVGATCIVVPRSAAKGEVVDDHQFDLVPMLHDLPGVTVITDESDLTLEALRAAIDGGSSS